MNNTIITINKKKYYLIILQKNIMFRISKNTNKDSKRLIDIFLNIKKFKKT
jgi:hypothetical protein